NAVVATVGVGDEPYDAAYDSAKGEVFITDFGSSTLSVISDATTSSSSSGGSSSISSSYVWIVAINVMLLIGAGSLVATVRRDRGPRNQDVSSHRSMIPVCSSLEADTGGYS
ncbi:MAG: hypothetical protein OK474_06765, partial [Thaumarchaeota archaeon]|nr:hypothetical protein [Nitrososphaerota archaeon]